MNTANTNDINILDLPDEILHTIFNKLNTVDRLYSLVDVNQRFDRVALDSLDIYHLDFVVKLSDTQKYFVDSNILDRICKQILPRINNKINILSVQPLSMERVLDAVHYPELHWLALHEYQPEIVLQHLTGDTILLRLLTTQITRLTIEIYIHDEAKISNENYCNMLASILSVGKYLNKLTLFQRYLDEYPTLSSLNVPYRTSLSSTLTELHICVNGFDDCLYLLNGCLESLSTLTIKVNEISRSSSNIDNTKKLYKLKCFSLFLDSYTYFYDDQVAPLLRRMLNLEELALLIPVRRTESTYIDGNQLNDEILKYMPRLDKFIFSIHTRIMNNRMRIDLPSCDDIRNSFLNKEFQQIDTFADDKLTKNRGNCYVYSLPYPFEEFLFMGNCFQGGRFDNVKFLSMHDNRPFEYELFKIISRDFPFLRILYIYNFEPQKNKQDHSSTLITFNHLFELNIMDAHPDYGIQFLSVRNIRLPRLTCLEVAYRTLAIVTNYFTNDMTRPTCAKVTRLVLDRLRTTYPRNFYSYFPCLNISLTEIV